MKPDFESMNETDVREIIVRPLLHRLGYEHGTHANIRSEVHLRYDRAFLGRKQPRKDPPLVGRADYICDATSYGRWVVEVKAPQEALSQDDVEQAHTYSAHPEISARYFLLTNGREFRLYATGQLNQPLLAWQYEETEQKLVNLFNVLSYQAIKNLAETLRPDTAKPLGVGLPSQVEIIGGEVIYGDHRSNHPMLRNAGALNGAAAAVTGGSVRRLDDGRIHSVVEIRSPLQHLSPILRAAGLESFEFLTAAEFVSIDIEQPTILQNVVELRVEPGLRFPLFLGGPELAFPVGFDASVYTEATGFVEGDRFRGILAFEYQYRFFGFEPSGIPAVDALFQGGPPLATLEGNGNFDVRFAPVRGT